MNSAFQAKYNNSAAERNDHLQESEHPCRVSRRHADDDVQDAWRPKLPTRRRSEELEGTVETTAFNKPKCHAADKPQLSLPGAHKADGGHANEKNRKPGLARKKPAEISLEDVTSTTAFQPKYNAAEKPQLSLPGAHQESGGHSNAKGRKPGLARNNRPSIVAEPPQTKAVASQPGAHKEIRGSKTSQKPGLRRTQREGRPGSATAERPDESLLLPGASTDSSTSIEAYNKSSTLVVGAAVQISHPIKEKLQPFQRGRTTTNHPRLQKSRYDVLAEQTLADVEEGPCILERQELQEQKRRRRRVCIGGITLIGCLAILGVVLAVIFHQPSSEKLSEKPSEPVSEPPVSELQAHIQSLLQRGGKATSIWMISKELSGTIPTQIGLLTDLKSINLEDNQLSGILPTELGLLTDLDYLHLGSNQLTGPIPTQIGVLTKLKSLYLSSNQLTGQTTVLEVLTNLWYLYLDDNQWTGSIPSTLCNVRNLQFDCSPALCGCSCECEV